MSALTLIITILRHSPYPARAICDTRVKRHELARTIALEDGEPWRVVDKLSVAASTTKGMPVAEGEFDSNGGISTAGVDYLRATAPGIARLARALAQGEVRGGRYFGGDVPFAFDTRRYD